jgi:hypothetical protein
VLTVALQEPGHKLIQRATLTRRPLHRGLLLDRRLMPPPRPATLKPLQQASVPPDGLVQLLVVAVLDQVGQDLQDAARAAVESQLSAGQVTLTRPRVDGRSLVDCPKASQRKGGHKPEVSSMGCARSG